MQRILRRAFICIAVGLLVLASGVAGGEVARAQSTVPPAPVPPRVVPGPVPARVPPPAQPPGSIRLTCTNIDSSTAARAIDIWVSYAGNPNEHKIKSMQVIWTLPDGSAVDRTSQYSRKLEFSYNIGWQWNGEQAGTTHTMDGFLMWVTADMKTGQPVKGSWKYTEEYWPTSTRAGREITFADGCTGTDGDHLD